MKTILLAIAFALIISATPSVSAQKTYCPQTDVMLQPLAKKSFNDAGDLRCDYGVGRYDLRFLCNTYNGKFADDARITKTGKLRCIWKDVKHDQ